MSESEVLSLSYGQFFFITVIGFLVLYFTFTSLAYYLFVVRKDWQQYQKKPYRPGQIKVEIRRSMISILTFGILALWTKWALMNGIYRFNFNFSWGIFGLELLGLFLWNELYFYIVHRTFHIKQLYKFHIDHHFSHVPSPFSAYSFHWSEGLILGAVMQIAMLFHDFLFTSIMLLPLMSILMNVLGHSNVDFFPKYSINHILSFSKRHSEHHRVPHTNFGFFLPFIDLLMGTSNDDKS